MPVTSYKIRNRKCCKCGNDKTYINPSGTRVWFNHKCEKEGCTGYLCAVCYWSIGNVRYTDQEIRYRQNKIKDRKCIICNNDKNVKHRYYDENGNWDRKSHICSTCYIKKYNNENMKFFTSSRSGNLSKNSTKGLGIIGECIFAKVRNLKIVCIVDNDFNSIYDLSMDYEYGIIQCKLKSPYYGKLSGYHKHGNYMIHFGYDHNFDRLGILCTDKVMKNIDRVYLIPEEELYGIQGITIMKEMISKYEKFRLKDIKPYNDAYINLMEYLRDKKYFGIEDIKKWLEMKE